MYNYNQIYTTDLRIEINKNQHVDYDCSCKNKRLIEIYLSDDLE